MANEMEKTDLKRVSKPAVHTPPESNSRDLARHIIQFDSSDSSTHAPTSLPMPAVMEASTRNPIPWPPHHGPVPAPLSSKPRPNAPLPQMDYVVVTWTEEEAKCLADTLTPGYASRPTGIPMHIYSRRNMYR
jgi:hypothetical protein